MVTNRRNHDGILFMVSIGDREWHITTHGYGMTAFNDDGLAYLKENVEPLLKDENFYGAFDTYADLCQICWKWLLTCSLIQSPFLPYGFSFPWESVLCLRFCAPWA